MTWRQPNMFTILGASISLLTLAATPAPAATVKPPPKPKSVNSILPALPDVKLPQRLAEIPNGMPNGALRDYGTPTPAEHKVCPFTGTIPVSLPVVNSPVGTSLPGLAGLNLPEPSVPSEMYGELCMSDEALAHAKAGDPPPVLVMNHGITYGAHYWDFPHQPEKYSTVNYLNNHGYATLNIDRLGAGRSDHPLSALLTATSEAEVIHQVVDKLKRGKVGPARFGHVGLVGHSYGTIINWLETSLYNDTDINIGTDYSDRVNPLTAGSFIAMATPAATSPLTANQPWAIDPGYLQPLPGPSGRDVAQLYHRPNADPEVIATDARLANTTTLGEIATFPNREYDGTHKNIRTPTFGIQGEHSIMTCGDDAQQCETDANVTDDPVTLEKEAKRFTDWQSTAFGPEACFRGAVIPEASHDVALHRNARQSQRQILFFADQAMGRHGEKTDHYRKTCASRGPDVFDTLPELNRLVPPAPVSPPPVDSITGPVLGAFSRRPD